jgi:hypothetical protein
MSSVHNTPSAKSGNGATGRYSVRHVHVGSAIKFASLLGGAAAIASCIAVVIITLVLQAAGTLGAVSSFVTDVTGGKFELNAAIVALAGCGLSLFVAAGFVVLITLATMLFNIAARLTGGPRITLSR